MNANCSRCGGALNTLGNCESYGCYMKRPSPYEASLGPIARRQAAHDNSITEAYILRALHAEDECVRLNRVVSVLRQRHREFAKMLKDAMPAVGQRKVNLPRQEYPEQHDEIDYWLARAGEIVAEFGG